LLHIDFRLVLHIQLLLLDVLLDLSSHCDCGRILVL
jgi:hypothetical protein